MMHRAPRVGQVVAAIESGRPFHLPLSLGLLLPWVVYVSSESDDSDDTSQQNAEVLYGLIHARYILTIHGLENMVSQAA